MTTEFLYLVKAKIDGELKFVELTYTIKEIEEMNDDTIYEDIDKKLNEGCCSCFNEGQNHCDCGMADIEILETFRRPFVGLHDVEGKQIYADSSVVEFEFVGYLSKRHILRGYFIFDNEQLRYKIKIINKEWSKDFLIYDYKFCSNFKIIDTIQENKLGLVK